MPSFQHILFPIDFSDRCRAVRPFVRSMAERFHAKVTLLHIVHIPAAWYGGFEGGYPAMLDLPAMEEAAATELNTFFEPLGGAVNRIVKMGDPAAEIVHFAEHNHVDAIMMPTHGYGTFRNFLLGSVTSKVLHDAKCPVWTATHTDDPDLPKHREIKNIMAAIDITAEAVPLIRRSAELASDFGAKLRLIHAVPGAGPDVHFGLDQDLHRFLLQYAREEMAKFQLEAGTDFEVCMEGGPISKVVREAALHHDADLIVMGRGLIHETFGQFRTNAYAIIRDAPCPVLSL